MRAKLKSAICAQQNSQGKMRRLAYPCSSSRLAQFDLRLVSRDQDEDFFFVHPLSTMTQQFTLWRGKKQLSLVESLLAGVLAVPVPDPVAPTIFRRRQGLSMDDTH